MHGKQTSKATILGGVPILHAHVLLPDSGISAIIRKKKKNVDLLLLVIVHFLLHIGELWLTCYSHVQNASHLWLLCHFVFIKCGDNF